MRYLCIHGHFYQPPRENPWLEAIELQDSAYPYHDWNERITAECYAPNAAARILDGHGRIEDIVNNYSRISFNFGPTFLSWAQANAPGLHQLVIEADMQSREYFGGHGSAIAQCYNHMIMPLANTRDKRTQVLWGIEDFRFRFGRDPEGMWLPETAVDLETLGIMAEHGIKYTILAPSQARLMRRIGAAEWVDVTGARIDPTRAYRVNTPSGKPIAVFFYDGPISRAVAFEGLLNNGEVFASRLLGAFNDGREWDQLAHIATDGESYGHHHRYGEMALAYALDHIESRELAKITNYGQYLELCPPVHEAEIYENTAWSCVHGVGRWAFDCGCNSGGHGGWNQRWRGPLRAALDWLRDEIAAPYETLAGTMVKDPWAARDDYIHVLLNRSPEAREAFLRKHRKRRFSQEEQTKLWRLLELQRHAMLMYTSCGWFFDELSGIETVQVIMYAGRVVQLAERFFERPLEEGFNERLKEARSNLHEYGNGADIYRRWVKPAVVNLEKVGAHYAISSLFETYSDQTRIYSYSVSQEHYRVVQSGRLRMLIGRARFTSEITQSTNVLSFGVLHFGDHNINAGVRPFQGEEQYNLLIQEAEAAFSRADLAEVIRLLDRAFGMHNYSLKSMFKDEQRKVLTQILDSTIGDAEALYRQLYENHAPLMRFLANLGTPMPKAFRTTAEYAINSHLRREFGEQELDVDRIRHFLDEAKLARVDLEATTLEYQFRKNLERMARRLEEEPENIDFLRTLQHATALLPILPFSVSLWTVQNICWDVGRQQYAAQLELAQAGDAAGQGWVDAFERLASNIALKIERPVLA
jgi:alpha-amylase/alpha-mannosidase (GH57 family)